MYQTDLVKNFDAYRTPCDPEIVVTMNVDIMTLSQRGSEKYGTMYTYADGVDLYCSNRFSISQHVPRLRSCAAAASVTLLTFQFSLKAPHADWWLRSTCHC